MFLSHSGTLAGVDKDPPVVVVLSTLNCKTARKGLATMGANNAPMPNPMCMACIGDADFSPHISRRIRCPAATIYGTATFHKR